MPQFLPTLLHYLPTALQLLLIFFLTIVIRFIIFRIIGPWLGRSTDQQGTSLIRYLINIVIGAIAILTALQLVGISITPVLTALGVGGLSLALALQDTLTNVVAGIQLLITKQIQPGNYVQLEKGGEGTVKDVSWRTTIIRTPDRDSLIVPNSQLANSLVKNFSFPTPEHLLAVPFETNIPTDPEKLAEHIRTQATKDLAQLFPYLTGEQVSVRWTALQSKNIRGELLVALPNAHQQAATRSTVITSLIHSLPKK